ncbi:hypothetical protein [Rahnella bonaserana]|jgi:hypothetical protein
MKGLTKARHSEGIGECLFLNRVGTVLFLVSLALFIAGRLSRFVWQRIFDRTFPSGLLTADAELLAIKPMVNIMMYAMPFVFDFMAMGLLIVGLVSHLGGFIGMSLSKKNGKEQ